MITRLLGGVLGAAAGAAAGLFGSLLVMGWLGVSDFEGQRAMMAVLLFAPVGGLVGMVLGCWLALRLTAARASAGATARWSALTALVLVGLASAGLGIAWLGSDRPLGHNGPAPRLVFEIRLPAGKGLADEGRGLRVTLDTDRIQMPAVMADTPPRREGDWLVLAGEVELYDRTSRRLLILDFGGGRQHVFDPRLASAPSASADWSPWRRVDFVFSSPDQRQGAAPGPDDRSEMRSRVRVF